MRLARSTFSTLSLAATLTGLLLTAARPAEPALPGKAGQIVFHSVVDGDYEIYVMNANGSQTQLTDDPAFDAFAAWSPSGTRIAFISNRDGNFEVYVMNADGSGQTRLTNNSAAEYYPPSWSPDGSKIAFNTDRDGNYEIYVMNADGSGQTRLTNRPEFDTEPAWSPSGNKIAFRSDDGDAEIFVVNADGTGLTQLTTNTTNDLDPAWSPDGSRIVFTASRDLNPEIYVMNADGTAQTRVTSNSDQDDMPVWSPDGTRIAFSSNRDGSREIYLMNRDGTDQARLTHQAGGEELTDWQPLSLAISPGSGMLATTQRLDLVLLLTRPGVTVTGGSATLDGQNVSAALLGCMVPGSLAYGRTFRCPNLGGSFMGQGLHTLTVTLTLSDGTSVSDTALYTVLANTEP